MSVEGLKEALQWVPFLSLVTKSNGSSSVFQHPLTIRLAEAAIIGLIVMYGTVQQTQLKLEYLNDQVLELRRETSEIRKQLRMAEQQLWRREGLNKLANQQIVHAQ